MDIQGIREKLMPEPRFVLHFRFNSKDINRIARRQLRETPNDELRKLEIRGWREDSIKRLRHERTT